jgi:ABC-2 type transport system ATP-binding protein
VRIEARGVGKRFGRVTALDSVSFDVRAGARIALLGPNGSGKSTLLRAAMGLVACEGELLLDGRSAFRERVAVARRLAYVPQSAPKLAAPVRELLSAIARVRDLGAGAVPRAAEALGLDLAPLARLPFRSLSGGTQQKLLLALAFACEASLLVLDEPTGSLDAPARDRFHELVSGLDPRTTLLLCSHRLDEVRPLVDHVLFLSEGRLAYDGPAPEFLASRTTSLIEAWADGRAAEAALAARGFRRTPAGAWVRSASHAEKMKLLEELPPLLGPALRNLCARDLESLDGALPPAGAALD